MTEEEKQAMLVLELRLHGVHADWIEWAFSRGIAMAQFMLDSLEDEGHGLSARWKEPM